jgi:myo-inositol-1-phosphate synthase
LANKETPIKEAKGKLGVLLPGLGAVSTTFIAGVEAIRKGIASPIGSLTQMGTIRLGKRTDNRSPLVKDFVPLADLNDLTFGGWDIFEEDCYKAAKHAGVLEDKILDQVKTDLESVKPFKAVFDKNYVKRLDGKHVKSGATKWDLMEQIRGDIQGFKKENNLNRIAMVWCGSTETYLTEKDPIYKDLDSFRKAMK